MLHSCPFRPQTTRGIIECDCFRLYEKSPLSVIISRIGSKIFKLLEFQNLRVLTKILFFTVELFQRYISSASVRSMGPQNFTQPFICKLLSFLGAALDIIYWCRLVFKLWYWSNSWILFRSDFIYDLVEQLKPSVPTAGTKKSSRKRPTVSSQFKVCLAIFS